MPHCPIFLAQEYKTSQAVLLVPMTEQTKDIKHIKNHLDTPFKLNHIRNISIRKQIVNKISKVHLL